MGKTLLVKTALVTGSTNGLGREIVEHLAAAGCRIAFNGFGDEVDIQAQILKLKSIYGVEVFHHGVNLTIPTQITELITQVTEQFGPIDILINNAGMQFVSPLETFPVEKWDAIIALNLTAAFHSTKAVLPGMRAHQWGRIINISSSHHYEVVLSSRGIPNTETI